MITFLALSWTMAALAEDGPTEPAPTEAPPEETALEPDVELRREEEPPPAPGLVPGPWVGGALGVASPASLFDPAALLRVEAGWVPGLLGGRFQPIAALTLASPSVSGSVDEGDDHASFYEAHQRTTTALVGVNVRLFSLAERISPEIGAAPALIVTRTRVEGTLDGEPFSPTVDRNAQIGAQAWAGISGRLAGGLLSGQLSWTRYSLGGPITGEGRLSTVTPTVGYRMSL